MPSRGSAVSLQVLGRRPHLATSTRKVTKVSFPPVSPRAGWLLHTCHTTQD